MIYSSSGSSAPSQSPPEGGGAPIYAAAALLRSFITIAGSYSVPFFIIPKKILVIFPAIAIKDRAVSFENGVGKQEQPSFFEITVDRQASELFLHNH